MEHCPESKFQGANMGPSGADRTQVGPMLAPWTLPSGSVCYFSSMVSSDILYHIKSYDLFWSQRNAKPRLIMVKTIVMLVVTSSATQSQPTTHSLISFNYKECYMMTLQIKWYKLQVEISCHSKYVIWNCHWNCRFQWHKQFIAIFTFEVVMQVYQLLYVFDANASSMNITHKSYSMSLTK